MSCGVGCRHGSGPTLLWLWRGPVAIAPIGPLARESPYAAGEALKGQKDLKKKKKKKRGRRKESVWLLFGAKLCLPKMLSSNEPN